MQNRKRILLILTGTVLEPVRRIYGDAADHFERILGKSAHIESYPVFLKDSHELISLNGFDGVIMSGSTSMLEEDLPWMRASMKIVEHCLVDNVPFLGVCFGHQILGAVCGAKVGPNPHGRAAGSRQVIINSRNALFDQIPDGFWAQVSHRDVILEDNARFKIVASSNHDPRHSIQVSKRAFGVQFHPEWDMKISGAYVETRKEVLGDSYSLCLDSLKDSTTGSEILTRFVQICGQERENENNKVI